jgi:hypothetical protein
LACSPLNNILAVTRFVAPGSPPSVSIACRRLPCHCRPMPPRAAPKRFTAYSSNSLFASNGMPITPPCCTLGLLDGAEPAERGRDVTQQQPITAGPTTPLPCWHSGEGRATLIPTVTGICASPPKSCDGPNAKRSSDQSAALRPVTRRRRKGRIEMREAKTGRPPPTTQTARVLSGWGTWSRHQGKHIEGSFVTCTLFQN